MMNSKRILSNFISLSNFCSNVEANKLKIGDVLWQTRVFTNTDVVEYSKVSYDSNPLHLDTQCAQNAGFRDRIVHGMLVASLFPRIISSHFPGAVYVSQSLQFKQPVYLGEEISGEVQAINVREFKKKYLAKFSTKCFKGGDILVLDGEATAILPSTTIELQRSMAPLRGQERMCFGLYERFLCTAAKSAAASNGCATSAASADGGSGASAAAAAAEALETKISSGSNSGDGGNSQGSQRTGDAGKPVRGSPVSWMSFFLLLVTGAGIVFYYDKEKKRHIEEISNASNAVRQGPSVGQAAIGGPFNLINHEGKKVTEKDFLGKWTVLYFGFTHCPDICPDELQKLAAAVDKIKGKSGIEIVPVFISVDPERDTVEQVSEYVKEFHPKLIGLTGDPEEIRKVARAYRVYYMKTTEEGLDYLVDHSVVMYLMSPEMKFLKFYGKNSDVNGLTNGIINEMKHYKK